MRSRLVAFGLAVSALAFAPTSASADGPYRGGPTGYVAAYNWGGFYVGGNLGWMSVDDIGGASVLPPPRNFVAGGHDSGVAGFHFGAQHQWGGFVLGVELGGRFSLDGDFASTRGTGIAPLSGCNAVVAFACEGRLDKILQIGPRLGWAGDKWLVYGTGGYARAEIDTRERTIATGVILSDLSEIHRGWFLGAGVEFALTRNLILGVEYTRYDFDDKTHFDAIIPGNSRFVSADVDMVTARLSYKFGREECCAPLK